MKTNHYSLRSFTLPALHGIVLGLLASGFIACRSFGADAPTPAPKVTNSPAVLPPVISSSGSNGSPMVPGGISASVGDIDSGSAAPGPDVIGRIGNKEIKTKDIRAIIQSLDPGEQAALAADPALLKRAVLTLLVEPMVIDEINSKKWDQQPDVQAHLARVRQTTMVNMYLKTVSDPPKEYPSDAELRTAYEARKDSFLVPHKFDIAQIFIAIPAEADKAAVDKARIKLEAVIKSLKKPDADFAAIAHSQSDDTKIAAQSGDMGWLSDDQLPTRIRYLAITLPKNTVSEPVRLEDGWHLIKVLDSKDMAPLAFEEVKDKLAQQLRAERAKANFETYIGKLMQQNPITLDENALPQLVGKPNK